MSSKKVRSDSPTKPKHEQSPKKIKRINKFYLGSRERYIVFSSNFDSGNIECVKQISEFQYRLGSIPDNYGTPYEHNTKGWFYFSVTGFPNNTRGRFYIERVQTLLSIQQSKHSNSYRPVYKVGDDGQWFRLTTQATLFVRENDIVQVCFEFAFKKQTDVVYFAFCYPFSYADNMKMLQELGDHFYIDEFYYHQEVMTFSPEGRAIHLLTISSHDQKDTEHQIIFDPKLFPQNNRPIMFRKPVILITARVHPAQTPASYAMQGVLKFLTDKQDLRAYLLRQMFVFMVVPMINVDGVHNGHFRMDTYGNNLNRHYINPDPEKHPAVYAIKHLAEHLNQDHRLTFYFDLHAHNAKKGCFIYGNAINDFVDQVQSQVFCKLFAMNCKNFEYDSCNFSMKHMKARDRFEDLTKEGCGRVVMHRLTGIIHSFSLECGLISSNQLNMLADPANPEFKVGQLGIQRDATEDNNNQLYSNCSTPTPLYTPALYQNVGKALLISILDTFDKNPYNRVYSSQIKTMNMLRRLTAFDVFHNAERFRMFQRFTFHKVKNINELMKDKFKVKFDYNRIWNINESQLFRGVQWPPNIAGLCKELQNHVSQSPRKHRPGNNLYTGNSEEDNQNDIYSDLIAQMREVQNKSTVSSVQDRQNAQTTDCFMRSLSPEGEVRAERQPEPLQNLQQIDQQSHAQHQEVHSAKIEGEIISNYTNTIHSRDSRKVLINVPATSPFVNLVIPEQMHRKSFHHHPRRDIRAENHKRKQSRKHQQNVKEHGNRIEQIITHHNNFKLAMLEETIKQKDGRQRQISYILSKNQNLHSNLKLSGRDSQHVGSKQLKKRSDSLSRPKKLQMMSAKRREIKRHSSRPQRDDEQHLPQLRFPEICQDKLYPYATAAAAFLDHSSATDLNDMMKSTLKFEALQMKEIMKSVSRSRG